MSNIIKATTDLPENPAPSNRAIRCDIADFDDDAMCK